jgi:hypothetical protein
MTAGFVDANKTLADDMERMLAGQTVSIRINQNPDVRLLICPSS